MPAAMTSHSGGCSENRHINLNMNALLSVEASDQEILLSWIHPFSSAYLGYGYVTSLRLYMNSNIQLK